MAGSSRPSINYNPVTNRWEIRGKGGVLRFAVDDASNPIGKITAALGSNAALASIGSYSVKVGSIAITGVGTADAVFATPRVALPSNVFVGGINVSGNGNINFSAINMNAAVIASMPAMGWDIIAIRRI